MKQFIISLVALFSVSPVLATAPKGQILPTATRNDIQLSIDRLAWVYDIDPSIMRFVIECESHYDEKAYNPTDPYGGSYGIAQFGKPTFDEWSKKAGIKNANIYDTEDQLKTMAYMMSKGEATRWSCFRKVKNI